LFPLNKVSSHILIFFDSLVLYFIHGCLHGIYTIAQHNKSLTLPY